MKYHFILMDGSIRNGMYDFTNLIKRFLNDEGHTSTCTDHFKGFIAEMKKGKHDIAIVIFNPGIDEFNLFWPSACLDSSYPQTPFLFIHNGYASALIENFMRKDFDIIAAMPFFPEIFNSIIAQKIKIIPK